jgi:hypothetical protein
MKAKDKWAKEYIESLKDLSRRPGLSDVWLAGFEFGKHLSNQCNSITAAQSKEMLALGEEEISPSKN